MLAIVDADTGKLADRPDFLVRGFVHDDTTFAAAVPVIEKTLAHAASEGIGDSHQLEQMLGRDISRWAERKFRRELNAGALSLVLLATIEFFESRGKERPAPRWSHWTTVKKSSHGRWKAQATGIMLPQAPMPFQIT